MSDIHVSTSWTNIPDGDSAYNTVLACAGYDGGGDILFNSVQAVPSPSVDLPTNKGRGFHINMGYDGIASHRLAESESASLKTVTFTMSNAGQTYDLTDARCYVQFQNLYSVDIATYALTFSDGDTITTLASGGSIPANGKLEIDFKNDYGTGRFYFSITYSGDKILPSGWQMLEPGQVYNTGSNSGVWFSQSSGGASNYKGYFTNTNSTTRNVFTCLEDNTTRYFECGSTAGTNPFSHNATGSTYRGIKYGISNLSIPNAGSNYYGSYASAIDALLDAPSGGLDTSDLNNYEGALWQCRFKANVANISPGPMATESEGGTEGDFDTSSDTIAAPTTPTTYAPTGCHMYLIDAATLQTFHDIVYAHDLLSSIFSSFMDRANGIVAIMQYPIAGSDIPIEAQSHIYIGSDVVADTHGGTTTYPLASPAKRYITKDCGTVALNLFWDSALDLNPYTKLRCYIPGVGMVPLDPDIVMGHTIGLYYNIDLMTGAAAAVLTIDGDYLDQYACNLATQYALNGEQYSGLYRGLVSTAATAALGFATAGSGAAMAGTLTGAATSLMSQKISRDRAGNMGASQVLLSQLQPFIEIIRPIQQLPRDYTKYNAYPSYMTMQLVNVTGYAEVQDIQLDDIPCTDDERAELMDLLTGGVIYG